MHLARLDTWMPSCSVCSLSIAGLMFLLLQTLERSYLLRINGKVVERPQHMLMRVSLGIHKEVHIPQSTHPCL